MFTISDFVHWIRLECSLDKIFLFSMWDPIYVKCLENLSNVVTKKYVFKHHDHYYEYQNNLECPIFIGNF